MTLFDIPGGYTGSVELVWDWRGILRMASACEWKVWNFLRFCALLWTLLLCARCFALLWLSWGSCARACYSLASCVVLCAGSCFGGPLLNGLGRTLCIAPRIARTTRQFRIIEQHVVNLEARKTHDKSDELKHDD